MVDKRHKPVSRGVRDIESYGLGKPSTADSDSNATADTSDLEEEDRNS